MLLSTAMPTVRARPAKPVRVKAALNASMTANRISMFNTSAMLATMPEKR